MQIAPVQPLYHLGRTGYFKGTR